MIASDVPGTTRDSIAVDLERDGRQYRLIDTAGLRRRSRVEEAVEKFSAFKTLQAIESCQVAVVLLDASEGVTEQDATVLGHVLEAGRALVLAVNKWDGRSTYEREQVQATLARKLQFCEWAERVTISALHGTGLRELFRAIHRAHASATREFGTAEVTRALEIAVQSFPPPSVRGHAPKLRFCHPGGSNPPTLVVHGSRLRTLPDSYRRYLENFFRKRFKLVGTPVRFVFKEGENPYEGRRNELTERQVRRKRRLLRHVKRKRAWPAGWPWRCWPAARVAGSVAATSPGCRDRAAVSWNACSSRFPPMPSGNAWPACATRIRAGRRSPSAAWPIFVPVSPDRW